MSSPLRRRVLAGLLVALLVAGLVVAFKPAAAETRNVITAYFDNTNGMFTGDEVRILGVPVGKITSIEPQPDQVKVQMWFDDKYRIPADAGAAILAPSLVTARAIQLLPAYSGGPVMQDGAVIPLDRTAVPVEWDDLREQLEKLTDSLQPTEPGGVSTTGSLVNTAADNLRGQGADIRDTVVKLSQAFSVLGDHSADIFGSVRNLSILVSALESSSDLMRELNTNLAGVTSLFANSPNEISVAVGDLNTAIEDVRTFVAENRESMGTTADKLASVSGTVSDSLDDIEQLLHIGPTAFQNFVNIYQPAHSALTGAAALANFGDPITFLCGAVQAASRLGAEESAKLCVQYLAPIIKNRQYNFPPIGLNPFVGPMARPNEITYSEDRLRPDYIPAQQNPQPTSDIPLAAEQSNPAAPAPVSTDPNRGLEGIMVPQGGGA